MQKKIAARNCPHAEDLSMPWRWAFGAISLVRQIDAANLFCFQSSMGKTAA